MMMNSMFRRLQATTLTVLWLFGVGFPGGPNLAWAAYAPRVVAAPLNVGDGATERQAAKIHGWLNDELKARTQVVEWVPLPVSRATSRTSTVPPAEARALLAAGKEALADLKLAAAVKQLKKCLELFLADPARTDFEDTKEAYVSLAAAYFRMGEEKQAEIAMGALLRLDPQYSLGSNYPPIFARQLEKVRRRQTAMSPGELAIEGPDGSNAFVNGVALGPVPATKSNLAPGTYYVKVENSAGESFAQAVDVRPGANRIRASLTGSQGKSRLLGGPLVWDKLTPEVAAQAAQYTKSAGADYALLGIVYGQGDTLFLASALYGARQQGFFVLATVQFDGALKKGPVTVSTLVDEVTDVVSGGREVVALPYEFAPVKHPNSTISTDAKVEASATSTRKVIQPISVAVEPLPSSEQPVRLTPKDVPSDPLPLPSDSTVASKKAGVSPWVWVLVGAGVAAAAGGVYYWNLENQRPATGTLTAKW